MESLLELVAAMDAAAERGEWGRIEEFSQQLRVIIADVPAAERRAAIETAQRTMRRLHQKAESARHDITDKLSEIRRGRDAAKAYGSTY
ncbi:MAG: hypothetical protein QNJ07_08915 [Woeseiaceae bacterium]|nr:hypothetical protein [Woeseiaceae bacterium]